MTELIIKVDKEKFGNLMYALDRAEEKGYLPDAIAEEWSAFEWEITHATSAPNPSDKQEAVGYLSTEPRKWDQCRIKPQGSFTIPVFMHAERNEPLTDEEIEEISHQRETWSVIEFARAIIAAAPLAQSAEQDRIDAERYRRAREADYIVDSTERAIDNWIKGASK